MKKSPCGKVYTTCLCFLIECPNYLNQFCIVLLAALSCKKEFFLKTEIFYKISDNYWWGNCPTSPTCSDAPVVTLSTLSIFIQMSIPEIYNLFSVVKLTIRLFCFIPFLSASSKQNTVHVYELLHACITQDSRAIWTS